MKEVTMFIQESCPFCREALRFMERAVQEEPELAGVKVKTIDENKEPEVAESFDYYYVPTFYVDGEKMHEGASTFEAVRGVLRAAL